MKAMVLLVFLTFPFSALYSQGDPDWFDKSLAISRTGMGVLAGWSLANIATGSHAWITQTGTGKYFGQMNLLWNVVNLSIATFGFYHLQGMDPRVMSMDDMTAQYQKMKNLYLINAGLDLVYMGAGAYLRWLSDHRSTRQDLYRGYGTSMILQGGFLFLFDLGLYLLQQNIELPGQALSGTVTVHLTYAGLIIRF